MYLAQVISQLAPAAGSWPRVSASAASRIPTSPRRGARVSPVPSGITHVSSAIVSTSSLYLPHCPWRLTLILGNATRHMVIQNPWSVHLIYCGVSVLPILELYKGKSFRALGIVVQRDVYILNMPKSRKVVPQDINRRFLVQVLQQNAFWFLRSRTARSSNGRSRSTVGAGSFRHVRNVL